MSDVAFADRLFAAVRAKGSAVVVGIDPDPRQVPRSYFPHGGPAAGGAREYVARGVLNFCLEILEAVHETAAAVKPQLAYFERLGPPGIAAYEEVVAAARALGLLVIADGKRNDIASTAAQYAAAYLGVGADEAAASETGTAGEDDPFTAALAAADREGPKADALTVNPYLGWDGIEPFVDPRGERGLFVLVKTSNPTSGQLQDLAVAAPGAPGGAAPTAGGYRGEAGAPGSAGEAEDAGGPENVAGVVGGWLERRAAREAGRFGYGSIGAVVGATYPKELAALRRAMPHVPFLIPGYGAQGGGAEDVAGGFDEDGLGAVVNASRSILYAYRKSGETVGAAAKRAAAAMRDELARAVAGRNGRSASGS